MRRRKFVADFETNTDPENCDVWAVGIFEIKKHVFRYGNNIDYLFRFMRNNPNSDIYFHNLKFDGEFIIYYLLKHGFKWVKEKKEMNEKEFTTLISDAGQWYSISICMKVEEITEERNIINIYDSLKVLPMTVAEIPAAFGLNIHKLEIEYTDIRELDHELTDQEVSYLRNDCEIVALALEALFEEKLTKMTTAANALASFKKLKGNKQFDRLFPVLGYDSFIRKAYRGGFTYVNPIYQGKDIENGIVLDVNSLYPSRMLYEVLPYGEGKLFHGAYEPDEHYKLYIIHFSCTFDLKPGYLPTVQLKNNLRFNPTEYISTSNGMDIELYMTNVDYELFIEHYDVSNINFIDGYKFRGCAGMFDDYINFWNAKKVEATQTGNKALRKIAKLMLNSLYGKFGLSPVLRGKVPYLIDDVVKYRLGEKEDRDPIYIPVAVFITAYARRVTITTAQRLIDRFVYSDTDSLHLIGSEIPDNIDIDDTKIGAWAHESTFSRARFIRAKTYIEEINGELEVKCAGLPDKSKKYVTWENFRSGAIYGGKLVPKHVKGGLILVETDFTIKS